VTKITREASFLVVSAAFCAVNLYGLVHNHDWTQVLSAIGVSACAFGTIDHGMRLASAWRYRTLPAVHAEPTPDELRAPFMAVALAEVDDMKLGGQRLSAPKELPGPSLGAQLAGGWMSTGAGLANALPPANQAIANQREPEAFPAYPPGREPESVALQGQILDGWRESYRARGGRA
jgi:hypothetical protein